MEGLYSFRGRRELAAPMRQVHSHLWRTLMPQARKARYLATRAQALKRLTPFVIDFSLSLSLLFLQLTICFGIPLLLSSIYSVIPDGSRVMAMQVASSPGTSVPAYPEARRFRRWSKTD